VRETYREIEGGALYDAAGGLEDYFDHEIIYRADRPNCSGPWLPSIFMPRRASRITLEIISVRVERLNDISEEDAKAEGATICSLDSGPTFYEDHKNGSHKVGFAGLWQSINGAGSWDKNPWVWVVEFKRVKPC
jgi:hypothetical protein